jgi:hypothetical protein
MGRNDALDGSYTENILTISQIPSEPSRDVSNVTDIEFLCKLGFYRYRAKVDLILYVLQVNSMTASSNTT